MQRQASSLRTRDLNLAALNLGLLPQALVFDADFSEIARVNES
jgi:hypothetical protein